MLDYRRLCRGRRENGEANKRKNGVSCSTGISLLVFFFFFNSDRYRYRFFPPPFSSLPLALFCSRIYYPYSYYFASVRLI